MRTSRRPFSWREVSWLLASIGDSLTDGAVSGVATRDDAYTALLTRRLTRIATGLNLGQHGDTTALMYLRRASMIGSGVPDISIIYGGTNDPHRASTVQASPSPTSTVFTVGAGAGAFFAAGAWIFVDGESAQISSVSTDQITVTAPLAGGAPAAGDAVAFDTQKNLEAIASYIQGQGCSRVLIAGMHYFNWTSGGDTTGAQQAGNSALRTLQAAAAATAGAVYVDLYAHMRQLIIAGAYTQGDWTSWHSSVDDQHLNPNGQSILADAFEVAIRAQGWLW